MDEYHFLSCCFVAISVFRTSTVASNLSTNIRSTFGILVEGALVIKSSRFELNGPTYCPCHPTRISMEHRRLAARLVLPCLFNPSSSFSTSADSLLMMIEYLLDLCFRAAVITSLMVVMSLAFTLPDSSVTIKKSYKFDSVNLHSDRMFYLKFSALL